MAIAIVIGQRLGFANHRRPVADLDNAVTTVDAMNVWVQVGRAIVFVDPTTDLRDSLDPDSRIERAVSGGDQRARRRRFDDAPG